MKKYFLLLAAPFSLAASCQQPKTVSNQSNMIHPSQSIYSLRVSSLDGDSIDFSAFRGKKILIVNTASECGYTSQYKELQELHERFGNKIAVIGFPCDDFGGQEPGSEKEIRSFCTSKFHVSFPMAAKVRIKGEEASPVYRWLTQKKLNGSMDATVSWNFNKFLIDENGHLIGHYPTRTSPLNEEITGTLK